MCKQGEATEPLTDVLSKNASFAMLDKKYFETSRKVLKDGVNTYKSIYLENNMVGTMEQKISFGALQILLDDMNAEYDAKWKLECVRGFNFFFNGTKAEHFGTIKEGC